jgi:hypothetical protein
MTPQRRVKTMVAQRQPPGNAKTMATRRRTDRHAMPPEDDGHAMPHEDDGCATLHEDDGCALPHEGRRHHATMGWRLWAAARGGVVAVPGGGGVAIMCTCTVDMNKI